MASPKNPDYDYLPRMYSPAELENILNYHRDLAERNGLTHPYFLYTSSDDEDLSGGITINDYMPGIRLSCRAMSGFTSGEMAALVHEQTANYVTRGAFGSGYSPKSDNRLEKILAFMIDGFDPDTVCVVFEYCGEYGYKPLCAAKISFGKSDLTARALNGDMRSELSTLASLVVPPSQIPLHREFFSAKENEIVCMTRLFRLGQTLMDELGINGGEYYDYVTDIFSWLGIGIARHARDHRLPIKYVILDTSIRKVKEHFTQYYGAQCISTEEGLKPTPEIMSSPVADHYLAYADYLHYIIVPIDAYLAGIKKIGNDMQRKECNGID